MNKVNVKNKIKKAAYIVGAGAIALALIFGVFFTRNDILPFTEYKDSFFASLPYILIFFLIVQMISIPIFGKVKEYFTLFITVPVCSAVSFLCSFGIISLLQAFPIHKGMNLIDEVKIDLSSPAGMVWANYGVRWPLPDLNPVLFFVFAAVILTVFEYLLLRKNTESKKKLFWTILITSFLLCAAVAAFMQFSY